MLKDSERYGDFISLGPRHWGCNNCGAEYWCESELRYCPKCQNFEETWEQVNEDIMLKESESIHWEQITKELEDMIK